MSPCEDVVYSPSARLSPEALAVRLAEIESALNAAIADNRWRTASLCSVSMLVAPARLPGISLNCLLVGLGVYLGFVHAAGLIPSFGPSGSLGISSLHIVVTTYGIATYYIPGSLKDMEAKPIERFQELVYAIRLSRNTPAKTSLPTLNRAVPAELTDSTDQSTSTPPLLASDLTPQSTPLRTALEESIRAQEQSVQAGRSLLEQLRRSSG